MNLNRKIKIQERRIVSMQKQIDKLTKENETLRYKNQELLDKETQYQLQLSMVEEARRELEDCIVELNTVREQYQQMTYEARQIKKDFSKKIKPLIKQLKTQV